MKICPRRGFDAVSLVAEIDRVQIQPENLVLAVLPGQCDGNHRLAQLALQRVGRVRAEVQLLDELLRDGAAPFHEAKVNEIVPRGP